MAKLRKGVSYSKANKKGQKIGLDRPYTRSSRKRKLNFVRAKPNVHVVKFDMGDPNGKFSHKLLLRTKGALQIRHNALEAGRKSSNTAERSQLSKAKSKQVRRKSNYT